MTQDFFTVFYSKRRFDRISFYLNAEMAKEYTEKPADFYALYSKVFPEEIRGQILEALDKQWDFIIDIHGKEVIQLQGRQEIMDIKPKLNALEAERELKMATSFGSLFDRAMASFGYRHK